MVGYGKNKGIIPIVCEEIFKRIDSVESKSLHCEVNASMLEIYNEQIQDLLKPPNERIKGGLKIREDPKTGVYVQDLSKMPCSSYEEISDILDKGNSNRTVAATQMNATSSRAHTVLTISFTQIIYDDNGRPLNRKQSNINLVDLAGSERASKTGATGDTLKEGSNINKSLSTLGRVITTLAKRSGGSKEVVPYRESSLTRILQNALGGNSKTTMIAAISPATFNLEETISTLRYADQVKSIKNQAIVNETPQEKLIRELKEENEKLKAMLEGKAFPVNGGGGEEDNEESEALRLEFERQIEELRKAKEEAERTYQERVIEADKKLPPAHKVIPSRVIVSTPHLSNLNEDPLLSGHICHSFKEGKNIIGKKNPSQPPDIIIEGLGIGIDHCTVEFLNDIFTIYPSPDFNLKTTVNGKILTEPTKIDHQDRIKFGNHNFFLLIDPEELSNDSFDWEYAMKEAHEEEVKLLLGKQDEELKAKEDLLKKKLEQELEESKKQFEEEKTKLEVLMKSKSNNDAASKKALEQKEKEILERQRIMQEEMQKKEQLIKQHEDNRIALETLKKDMTHAIHQVNEANERAVLLGKSVLYQPELYMEGGGGIGKGLQRTKVRINVIYPNLSEDFKVYWGIEKLDARLIDMQEICNQIEYGVNINDIDLDYDPFSDNIDSLSDSYHLIGHAYMYLDTSYYLANIEDDIMAIINDQGAIKGTLNVSLTPRIEGIILEEYDNLRDLIGKELMIRVVINSASNLPQNYSTNVFCQYTMNAFNDEIFKTDKIIETNKDPIFNYGKTHKIMITNDVAEEFLSRALIISVYGDLTKERKQRELLKIKEVSNVMSISIVPGMKLKGLDFTDEELLGDMNSLQLNSPTIDNNRTVYNTSAMSYATDDKFKNEVSNKEKEIKKIEEEIKIKEKEDEKEINKRLKEI